MEKLKIMKCFGYTTSDKENLSELTEVTFQSTPEYLIRMAAFFTKCANDMENDPDWEHEHLRDHSQNNDDELDVIVFKDEC
ncbi:MAG TPA: hypothetical protein EYQ14_30435 [Gammaproteobacteria bacterium]|nr:hypothetical protein [Gammaproteobacteria bacterium]HIL96676.1 hypothetical protein [Pseudomonadales bacterium]